MVDITNCASSLYSGLWAETCWFFLIPWPSGPALSLPSANLAENSLPAIARTCSFGSISLMTVTIVSRSNSACGWG